MNDSWQAIVDGWDETAADPIKVSEKPTQPEPGFYRSGDEILQVKISRHGRWYANRAIIEPGKNRVTWEYVGQRAYIRPENRMSAQDAGRFTAHCVVCGYRLDTPESRERGMGPICAKRVNA